jgi:acyl transferase domain-containing protein/thioesterase domain-containing protein/acyl carrier protein
MPTPSGPSAVTEAVAETDIAIVGMAAHVPGAGSIAAFWANLRAGVESIRALSEGELLAAGESPAILRRPNYVRAAAPLEGFDRFEPEFFGLSVKEAAIMDPQHRQFLEVAWEALEDAGHPPERFPGRIGVFAGCGMGSYFYVNVCSNPDLVERTGLFLLRHTGNDKDFLSTRVSHILDLRGPSLGIQTACSTSLVAVHVAAQSLINGECDMALAGGVTIELPQGRGYLHAEGEILSPDGHCHAFDHRAQGTVFGSGAGCVVLRRLKDALADGDHIWAVIKGTAVNNDGAAKAGYLAPSVEGQAACVAEALAVAGVAADSLGYVECHGTGTYLGDPIEVAALSQAFRRTTEATGFCRIGSVKTNIGHLDTAAGVAGLIKAALAVKTGEIPPSLGYEAPNPAIDFAASPFRVADRLMPFPDRGGPRRAGVNSLGVGGTNAFAVLEEPPAPPAPADDGGWPFQLLVLSARTKPALDEGARRLAAHLRAHPEQPLADVAFTLKEGRRAFEKRRVLCAADHAEAAALLESGDPRRVFTHEHLGESPEVVFLFPGGGAQYPGMARDLYETEPVFRDWMDRGLAHLSPKLDYDLRALWLPAPGQEAAAAERLRRPSVQLPLILITEIALARLWMSWGVAPARLIGHSMGENAAACLAGVMGFEDCIDLVHLRGRLFDRVPPGGMLSVPLAEEALRPRLGAELDLASVNAPGLCVVSGPDAALDRLAADLAAEGVEASRIAIDIAAHSRMLEPILADFGAFLRSIPLSAPQIPVVSNRSGRVLTAAEATDPAYWVGHLRHTVEFARGVRHLMEGPPRVFLEVGPGKALSSLVQANGVPANQVLNSLRHPDQAVADDLWFVTTLGRLWALGVDVDWAPLWGGARRRRVPLPTYAFQRQSYFIAPGKGARAAGAAEFPAREADIARWGYAPHWRPRAADCPVDLAAEGAAALAPETWLLFLDGEGLAERIARLLRAAGHRVITVAAGDGFARLGGDAYALAPERGREGYDALLRDLVARGLAPSRIGHFWLVTGAERFRPGSSFFHRNLEQGFWSLMFLAQALGEENLPRPIRLTAVTTGAASVRGERLAHPEKAAVAGPLRVLPREVPGIATTWLDVELPAGRRAERAAALDALALAVLEDLAAGHGAGSETAALRGGRRLALDPRRVELPPADLPVEQGAVVMITGGFGGIGLTLAARLIRDRRARIVLVARTALPPRGDWPARLAALPPDAPEARRLRAVEALEALGGEVLTLAADVCNIEEMRAARAAAEARFGRVDVLIHAAGVVDDAPILGKAPAAAEAVLAPKITGTQVLDAVFPDGDLRLLVLFSSTSTAIAAAGQADYVAANEYLNALARARTGGRTKVLAIDWGVWAGVGMAAEALAARTGARPPAPLLPAGGPLLTGASVDAAGNRVFTAELSADRHWVIDGHRTADGAALLPGTGFLELAAEALALNGERGPFELADLTFFRPLAVPDGRAVPVRVRLTRRPEGYAVEIACEAAAGGRRGWAPNAQGLVVFGGSAPPPPLDLAALAARMTGPAAADPAGLRSAQEDHLRFGPRWRVLRETRLGDGEGLARLALAPEFAGEPAEGWRLHPALLDIATGWAMALIPGWTPERLWVPVAYGRVRVFEALPPEVASWVRLAGAEGGTARFDITLAAPDGRVVAGIEGFTLHRLDAALDLSRPPDPRTMEFPEAAGPARPLGPAEARLAEAVAQGITPEEGAEAFARALALGAPQVFVSPLDLAALVRAAGEAPAESGAGPGFARPELDSAYVAPRNDIERALAGFWQDLLGVKEVGVEDDFFALGGHSLIAVRLFAMIRRAFGVDFPISVLFEAPTIAACARLIEERIGPAAGAAAGGGEGASARRVPARRARRFTHLVAMHEGEGGPRRPFFLVAGMFGNVLNLRHLAQLLGGDRPFYGLQAKGLMGGEEPHRTIPEAAASCIAEMRQVQDRGPWFVGGFSGGGLTAWEIAQQLRDAGEEVAGLVLLDTPLPVRPALSRRDRALIKLHEFRRKGPGYLREWAAARIAWERAKRARRDAPPAARHEFHNAAIEAAFRAALPLYALRDWPGDVVLFRPPLDRHWPVSGGRWVSRAREYVLPDNGLGRFAPRLEVIEVPGDHDSMVLEPNVRVLAARMKAWIEAREGAAAADPAPPAADPAAGALRAAAE